MVPRVAMEEVPMSDAWREIAEAAGELGDAMNEALGFPVCAEPCSHGGRCSLLADHNGDHVALGSDDRELCRWEGK
jgi:hypothetical protein